MQLNFFGLNFVLLAAQSLIMCVYNRIAQALISSNILLLLKTPALLSLNGAGVTQSLAGKIKRCLCNYCQWL